jgi:hypothetical protein
MKSSCSAVCCVLCVCAVGSAAVKLISCSRAVFAAVVV